MEINVMNSHMWQFYKMDIKKNSLKVQLETIRTYFERQEFDNIKLNDIVDYLHMLEPRMCEIYSEVVKLIKKDSLKVLLEP